MTLSTNLVPVFLVGDEIPSITVHVGTDVSRFSSLLSLFIFSSFLRPWYMSGRLYSIVFAAPCIYIKFSHSLLLNSHMSLRQYRDAFQKAQEALLLRHSSRMTRTLIQARKQLSLKECTLNPENLRVVCFDTPSCDSLSCNWPITTFGTDVVSSPFKISSFSAP